MIILILFAFLAGIVTILSPCILPVLPIILATTVGNKLSRSRPYGVVISFVLSFTFFTLFLSTIVKTLGIPSDFLRVFSIIIVAIFGFSLLLPRFQVILESLFSRLANYLPNSSTQTGFGGGLLIGLSLGLLWTPCVGPILASVIALAISGSVTGSAVLITLAYSLGTAIPMFFVIIGGRALLTKVPGLLQNTIRIQQIFGIIMIMTAAALYVGLDRSFENYVINRFPQYGAGLTQFENNALVKNVSHPTGAAAPELIAGGQWFNSPPLTLAALKGKVVVLDFWTYTCINCQRSLPYLKSWYDKYHDQGLVIIGIHSPEFEFEKIASNVSYAITDFGIKYPVMQDNNFATWKAYNNQYWPAKYFIDKDGIIRHTHFGEGDYDGSEQIIVDLLRETGATISGNINNTTAKIYANTPETYLGSKRSEPNDYLTYQGKWTQSEEYNSPSTGAKLDLQFDAKSAYLVMKNNGKPAVVKVSLDGVYTQTITVDSDKLYTLVDLNRPGVHNLELEFEDGNAQLFAFTFG